VRTVRLLGVRDVKRVLVSIPRTFAIIPSLHAIWLAVISNLVYVICIVGQDRMALTLERQ